MKSLLLTINVLSILALVRAVLVFRIEMKELEIVSAQARAAIVRREKDWSRFYQRLNNVSFNHKVLDLTKWSHRQFYPDQ